MTYPFTLRRATTSDQSTVLELSRAIDPHDWIPGEYTALVAAKSPSGLFLAEQEGRLAACHFLEFPGPGDAYLSAMRVQPSYQGKGLGTLVCRAQVDQARALGGENIYLLSAVKNKTAHRVVEKNGFENRGEWVIYPDVTPVKLPVPRKARACRPQDKIKVLRFREEHPGTLSGVIASTYSAWVMKTLRDSDWDPSYLAVVEGEKSLEGILLYRIDGTSLLIRKLEGTPAAAADLLAFAAQESQAKNCIVWNISLPQTQEDLLAPLNLDPSATFRPYVFCFPAGKEMPQ